VSGASGVEQAENAEVRAPRPSGALEVYFSRSFLKAYSVLEDAPFDFMMDIANDANVAEEDRALASYYLGYFKGLAQALAKADFYGLGSAELNKPETIKQFLGFMEKLLELYNDYKAGEFKDSAKLMEAVNNLEINFENFVGDIMARLRVQR